MSMRKNYVIAMTCPLRSTKWILVYQSKTAPFPNFRGNGAVSINLERLLRHLFSAQSVGRHFPDYLGMSRDQLRDRDELDAN